MLYNLRKKNFIAVRWNTFVCHTQEYSKLELRFLLIFAHYEIFGYDTLFHYR
jgi:hypothetical protein